MPEAEIGISPSGTLEIVINGTYDITNYATAEVNVETGGSIDTCTLTIECESTQEGGGTNIYRAILNEVTNGKISLVTHSDDANDVSKSASTFTVPCNSIAFFYITGSGGKQVYTTSNNVELVPNYYHDGYHLAVFKMPSIAGSTAVINCNASV